MSIMKGLSVLPCLGLLLVSVFPAAAGGGGEKSAQVNVYSHRHYEADQRLYELFEQQTGIHVNALQASADELIERLRAEGDASPADVLITVDASRLNSARDLGLLQPTESAALKEAVPAEFRDPDGYWYGLTRRARVIAYHKGRVQPEELSSYEALTDAKWRGRILVRSSGNIYNISLLASMIAAEGEEAARAWAAGIVANMARTPQGSDRDQMKAVAAGQGDLALVNTYYVGLLLNSENPAEREVGGQMGVFFPSQGGRGAHVNVSGAGVTRSAPNRENAIRFIEFLAGAEAQSIFATANYEYPIRPDVPAAELLQSWGGFRSDTDTLLSYSDYVDKAVRIFDEAGWR
jgi:iron(III) transport system substrate-binding protein